MMNDINVDKTTPFYQLAKKYNTDKWVYSDVYHSFFSEKRNDIKKIFELGIGYPGIMKHMTDYKIGASLYLWRDYFPNAKVYAADNVTETIFEDDRIETYLCDEDKPEELIATIDSVGRDIDVFVDDGSHNPRKQLATFRTVMPLLKKDAVYIIEDIYSKWFITRRIQKLGIYNCIIPEKHCIIIITNK